MIEAIIFDMDGVLIDSEKYHLQVEREVLRRFGVELSLEIFKDYAGSRFEEEFQDLIERFHLPTTLPEILALHQKIAQKYYEEIFPAMPGARETLAVLSENYPLALVTGSPRELAKKVLKRLGLLPYFQESVFMEDVTKGKPNPEGFLKAAQKLNSKNGKTVVVEDSLRGFQAAKAAEMPLIAYRSSHNAQEDFSLADEVIEDLNEIPKILSHSPLMRRSRSL